MEAPYITQDVTGIIFRIKYYGSHTTNVNTINHQYYSTKELKMADKKLRLDTITTRATPNTHEGWVGGAGQAMVDGNKNKRTPKHHVTHSTLHTLKPILPVEFEKNIFCFICSSASINPLLLLEIQGWLSILSQWGPLSLANLYLVHANQVHLLTMCTLSIRPFLKGCKFNSSKVSHPILTVFLSVPQQSDDVIN